MGLINVMWKVIGRIEVAVESRRQSIVFEKREAETRACVSQLLEILDEVHPVFISAALAILLRRARHDGGKGRGKARGKVSLCTTFVYIFSFLSSSIRGY